MKTNNIQIVYNSLISDVLAAQHKYEEIVTDVNGYDGKNYLKVEAKHALTALRNCVRMAQGYETIHKNDGLILYPDNQTSK